MDQQEAERKTEAARARLPMRRILEEAGSGPRDSGEKWNSFKCPFCRHKAGGVFTPKGKSWEKFKCFHEPCDTENKALDEVGLIGKLHGLDRGSAWKTWLQSAGVWEEERHAPSILPGSSRRHRPMPDAPAAVASGEAELTEDLIEEAKQTILNEGRVSVALLQRRLRLAPGRALALVNELEKRGCIGPATGAESREIYLENFGGPAADLVRESTTESLPCPPEPGSAANDPQTQAGAVLETSSAPMEDREGAGMDRSGEKPPGAAPVENAPTSESLPTGEEAHTSSAGSGPAGTAPSNTETDSEPPENVVPISGLFGNGGGNGGGSRAGGGGGSSGSGEKSDDDLMALREFYAGLILTGEDEAKLMRDRGLTRETARALGYRSNRKENRDLLFALEKRYTKKALVKAGLWVWHEEKRDSVPNAQLTGFGIVGKKPKPAPGYADEEETEKDDGLEWGWTHPILIPYFGEMGDLYHLRPHKGQRKGAKNRFYMVRAFGEGSSRRADVQTDPSLAIITESEFKAAALWQVLGGGVACASIPGISNGKNPRVQEEIRHWLMLTGMKRVIIAYDNEEKSDPNFPMYKEDPAKRYDTQVWALFLAKWLEKHGFEGRVAWLPNEWRDEKGKADWDGVLARRIRHEKKTNGQMRTVEELEKTWGSIAALVREEWWQVLNASTLEVDENGMLFGSQAERIIQNQLARRLHEPRLPFGGKAEWEISEVCFRLGRDKEFELHGHAMMLAEAFREVQGRYYAREPLKIKYQDKLLHENTRQAEGKRAAQTGDFDKYIFYTQMLLGRPKGVSDFRLDCKFVVVRPNGSRQRMVTLHGRHAPGSRLVSLDSKSFTAPRDFREWLADQGNWTWEAGERELQALQLDVNHTSAYMDVHQVTWFGWYSSDAVEKKLVGQGRLKSQLTDAKLWFSDDCAITADGQTILPDRDGVIWWNGLGYMMSDTDWEGEGFRMNRPKWHPTKGLRLDTRERKGTEDDERYYKLEEGPDEPDAILDLFQNLASRFKETLGGYEGYLVLGSTLAFAAAPEYFERERSFPGVWLHGQRGEGKTTLANCCMRCWGIEFNLDGAPKITKSSPAGLAILAQQYSNIPVWLEEFQNSVEEVKVDFIKGLFNRELTLKKEFGEQRRHIRTNAIITGEATSTDSATHSRFPHVQVSKVKRQANHYNWFQRNWKFFFSMGRFVLLHRKRYVELFLKYSNEFKKLPALQSAEDRTREVHGVPYAGFMALAEMLGSHLPQELEEFRDAMVAITALAVKDVREEVNVNKVWQVILDAWKVGAFGKGSEVRQYFRAMGVVQPAGPPGRPNQTPGDEDWRCTLRPWKSYKLYLDYSAIHSKLLEHLMKRRLNMPLDRRDIRDQMAKEPYWVPGECKQRMGSSKATTRVWCIDVDRHPLGYQAVSDEELRQSRLGKDPGTWIPTEDWEDPRLGELYQIIFEVENRDE